MVALVIILTVVVLLLTTLVAGLLRSHADILRALHSLGAGVGDPSAAPDGSVLPVPVAIPFTSPLPSERDTTSAPPIAGVTPSGDALAISFTTGTDLTLLAFLSTGCATCAQLWASLRAPERLGLPAGARLVVVTKGPQMEIPAEVAARAPASVTVIMSTEAWVDFEVPGSPFFILVDGARGTRIGEGAAHRFDQVTELVRRAQMDAGGGSPPAARPVSTSRAHAAGLDGPAREAANDAALAAAGIGPGDPSLYPRSLAAVFGHADGDAHHHDHHHR